MLQKLVENAYERSYYQMTNDIEMQDAKDEWIDSRADELIKNFSNKNDWQILVLLKSKLDNNCVDADIYDQFITDICYSQARVEYDKEFKDWR